MAGFHFVPTDSDTLKLGKCVDNGQKLVFGIALTKIHAYYTVKIHKTITLKKNCNRDGNGLTTRRKQIV